MDTHRKEWQIARCNTSFPHGDVSRRVVVRRKILRPRHRHRVHSVVQGDRPLAVVPAEAVHPAAGYEASCDISWDN